MSNAVLVEFVRKCAELSRVAWQRCVETTLPGLAHAQAVEAAADCAAAYDDAIQALELVGADGTYSARDSLNSAVSLERMWGDWPHARAALSAVSAPMYAGLRGK
jgi:hypothetical protein